VFCFGGKRGLMTYLDGVDVLDCGSRVWTTPPLEEASMRKAGRWDAHVHATAPGDGRGSLFGLSSSRFRP
jgi:hypothetical protein